MDPDQKLQMDSLLKRVSKLPSLSAKETHDLYLQATEENDKAAKAKLVRHNLKLVAKLATLFSGNSTSRIEDIFQAGCTGLVRSINKGGFDPQRGAFSTYAALWINAEIKKLIENEFSSFKVNSSNAGRLLFWHRTEVLEGYKTEAGRRKILDKYTKKFSIPLSEAEIDNFATLANYSIHSMDREIEDAEKISLHDTISNEELDRQAYSRLRQEEITDSVRKAMVALPPNLFFIIEKRFFEDQTLQEIGWHLGVSRERIRQMETRALKVLHQALNRNRVSPEIIEE